MAESPIAQERHPFQLGSLILGLLVVVIALLFLVNDQGVVDVDQAITGAALLLVVAVAAVVRAVVRLLSPRS